MTDPITSFKRPRNLPEGYDMLVEFDTDGDLRVLVTQRLRVGKYAMDSEVARTYTTAISLEAHAAELAEKIKNGLPLIGTY